MDLEKEITEITLKIQEGKIDFITATKSILEAIEDLSNDCKCDTNGSYEEWTVRICKNCCKNIN